MIKMGQHKIEGYYDYVVPPLEGFWWQDGVHGVDYARKMDFQWISLIRLPEFVTEETFRWAVREATEKKQADFSKVEFLTYEEGLSVQCMHIGSYDEEPKTVKMMGQFIEEQGYYVSEHCPYILYDKKALQLKENLPFDWIEKDTQNQYTLLASAWRQLITAVTTAGHAGMLWIWRKNWQQRLGRK